MLRLVVLPALVCFGLALSSSCNPGGGGAGLTGSSGTAGSAGSDSGTSGTGAGGGIGIDAPQSGGSGGGMPCGSLPTDDADNDGFTGEDGDCNDCDANANPGALDVPGNGVDEDCNGTPDDAELDCDSVITSHASTDPNDAARAIGLCHFTTESEKSWGVISANYVLADGSPGINPLAHGLLEGFGANVQPLEGKRLLVLSSGTARTPGDPDYKSLKGHDMGTTAPQPPGFPIDTPSCPNVTTGGNANDPAALELVLRVPTNAQSFSFKFNFYTYEYPAFICSPFNDFFVALQEPPPPNHVQGNISFDFEGNPVSVNNSFLEACTTPGWAGPKYFSCQLGASQLQGTGFDETDSEGPHAATGWLATTSPVTPGSVVRLRFAIWDVGDHVLDSSVLIDEFRFSAEEASQSHTAPIPPQ
jgi:hypothetical protein